MNPQARLRRPQRSIRRPIKRQIAETARPCRLRGVPTPVWRRRSSPMLQAAALDQHALADILVTAHPHATHTARLIQVRESPLHHLAPAPLQATTPPPAHTTPVPIQSLLCSSLLRRLLSRLLVLPAAPAALRLRYPRWTGQIRPFVDTANPAISGVPRRHLSSTSRARVRARMSEFPDTRAARPITAL